MFFYASSRRGGSVDAEKRRALSNFYREEFLRHFEFLLSNGILLDAKNEVMHRTCKKLMSDLDRVCWRAGFPAVAETLLQNFDALTRLSELDPRQRH
jgi:hypothetical protein